MGRNCDWSSFCGCWIIFGVCLFMSRENNRITNFQNENSVSAVSDESVMPATSLETKSNDSEFILRLVPVNTSINKSVNKKPLPVNNIMLPDDEIRRNKTFVVARIED